MDVTNKLYIYFFQFVAVICIHLDDQIMKDEIDEACGMYGGEKRVTYRILVRKPNGKSQLVRPRRRWEGSIEMDHK